jgi:DHA2 family lincomycin resistance protein-like MFS transporter
MSSIPAQQHNEVFKTTPILISFLIAGFIGLFSETALNMALGDLIQVFSITPSAVQWLTTGYLLTLGILVPVSGLLMQWFTTRQLFIASLIFSIVGTLIAALACTNFWYIISFTCNSGNWNRLIIAFDV